MNPLADLTAKARARPTRHRQRRVSPPSEGGRPRGLARARETPSNAIRTAHRPKGARCAL